MPKPTPRPDPESFVRERFRLAPVPGLPSIALYAAHPGSGLRAFIEAGGKKAAPPYWAYQWAGGLALAHHFAAHPEAVAGKRVLDLGSGCGLVGIAAAQAGAASVLAAEIDPYGLAAIALNAAANGVGLDIIGEDLLDGPPPPVDLVAVGDLFYDAKLAQRVVPFLERCQAQGIDILVGDPGRVSLPLGRLRRIADYPVADVGDMRTDKGRNGMVFAFLPSG